MGPKETVVVAQKGQRDAKGWFTKGNTVSLGHKSRGQWIERYAELRHAMASAVTVEELVQITRRLVHIALHEPARSAIPAATILLDRILGKPVQPVIADVQSTQTHTHLSVSDLRTMLDQVEAEENRRQATDIPT